jgi:hypothetical protein
LGAFCAISARCSAVSFRALATPPSFPSCAAALARLGTSSIAPPGTIRMTGTRMPIASVGPFSPRRLLDIVFPSLDAKHAMA